MKKLIKTLFRESIISESKMGLLINLMQKYDCAILTASKGGYDKLENDKRNQGLKSILLESGFSVVDVDGSYIEKYKTELANEVKEDSFFVANIRENPDFHEIITELGGYFNQESVLFVERGAENAYLVGTSEGWPGIGKREDLGGFNKGENEFMTRIDGEPFYFGETIEMLSEKEKQIVESMALPIMKQLSFYNKNKDEEEDKE